MFVSRPNQSRAVNSFHALCMHQRRTEDLGDIFCNMSAAHRNAAAIDQHAIVINSIAGRRCANVDQNHAEFFFVFN